MAEGAQTKKNKMARKQPKINIISKRRTRRERAQQNSSSGGRKIIRVWWECSCERHGRADPLLMCVNVKVAHGGFGCPACAAEARA